jgi:hypothetical protein
LLFKSMALISKRETDIELSSSNHRKLTLCLIDCLF